jgi:hypothetical protein
MKHSFLSMVSLVLLSMYVPSIADSQVDGELYTDDSTAQRTIAHSPPVNKSHALGIALSGEAGYLYDFNSGGNWISPNQFLFGTLIRFNDRFSFSILGGAIYDGAIPKDTIYDYSARPSTFDFALFAYGAYSLPNVKAFRLSIYGGGLFYSFSKWAGYNSFYDEEVYYRANLLMLKAGIEPEIKITEGFCIYSRFGVSYIHFPNSKYCISSTNNNLRESNDAHTLMSSDILLFGFRFYLR